MDVDRVFELDARAVASVRKLEKRRFAWDRLVQSEGRPFVAVLGARGAGKTVLLRQLRARLTDALYLSADALEADVDLFELARRLQEGYGVTALCIDEIHFVRDYARHLKLIHDFLPVRLWFTSSVAFSLTAANWDLSRRVVSIALEPFSYREYLWFAHDQETQPLPLERCLSEPIPPDYLRMAWRFTSYLEGGLHPFQLAPGAARGVFENMLEKVITSDIPGYDPSLSVEDLDNMRKVVRFIGRSPVDGINYSSVAANVGFTKYKAEKYLEYLERSFILTRIFPAGTNVTKEPKVLMQLPYRLLYRDWESAVGAIREDFFAHAMRQHGYTFTYAKSTRGAKTPDYLLDLEGTPVVVEIGGKGKGRSQFKELDYERKVVLYDNAEGSKPPIPGQRVPLFCLGFA
jgi:hypothetical protein